MVAVDVLHLVRCKTWSKAERLDLEPLYISKGQSLLHKMSLRLLKILIDLVDNIAQKLVGRHTDRL